MGRPLSKIFGKQLKFMIANSGKMNFSEMAKKLKVHHTTCLYWRDKLAERGIHIESRTIGEADKLLDKLYGKSLPRKNARILGTRIR